MAISHLMDVGIRHLTEENVKETCKNIMKQDDSRSFMTNEFMCELIWLAHELSKVPHIDLLIYIQRYVDYDACDDYPSYGRVVSLLRSCVDWETSDQLPEDALSDLHSMGFTNEEINFVGMGHLIKEERYCETCGENMTSGYTAGNGEWYCCADCFERTMNADYGVGKWRTAICQGEYGGYYEYLNKDGEWEDTGIYYTEWE
jgi:hypothetical protein